MHLHEAEKLITVFVDHDRDAVRRLAAVYDPDVPVFENEAYMKLAREIQDERAFPTARPTPTKGSNAPGCRRVANWKTVRPTSPASDGA